MLSKEKNGIMGHGRINKKICIVILGILCISLSVAICYFVRDKKKVTFEDNGKLYFKLFANTFDEDEYEFHSLDAYYLEDTQTYYYNGKYKAYIVLEGKWCEIDEVNYGRYKVFDNMYCRSWDELYGYEDVDKEFERAMREGIHKSYTKEEIEKLLEEAYNNKE